MRNEEWTISDSLTAATQSLDRAREILMQDRRGEKLYQREMALHEIEEAELSVARVMGLIEGTS